MTKIRLGRTALQVNSTGFGALPIQRLSLTDAKALLCKAFAHGIDFYDTARYYTDSEAKIGSALCGHRHAVIIATKSAAATKDDLLSDLATSLRNLKTDYVDIMQLHNPPDLPDRNDPKSSFAGLLEARRKGMTRFIGITNHKLSIAIDAARSGLYDTIHYPLNTLSSEAELTIIDECKINDCGLIAMKPMSGGLISDAASAYAYLMRFGTVLPVWGIQKEAELDQFIALQQQPPVLTDALMEIIEKDRQALAGKFCRGCGYCMPCPAHIEINWVARMSLLLRRAPSQNFDTDGWRAKMEMVDQCLHCGKCKEKCPYGLDTPALLKDNLVDYRAFFRTSVPRLPT